MNDQQNSREQLNQYFAAELAALRDSAVEFSYENPSIAQELMLNKHNEGKSRDPHVEMLIQSFAWMTSRLRQNMESESSKMPAALLQQLYPQLTCSIPSMAIAECHVNTGATFDNGYLLSGRKSLEPVKIDSKGQQLAKLKQCRMSTCYDSLLWPLKVTQVESQPLNKNYKLSQKFPLALSNINIGLTEIEDGAAKDVELENPLRFYINLGEQQRFKMYDFIARHFIGAAVREPQNNKLIYLDKQALRWCGFADNERLFPVSQYQDSAFTLLQDYFCLPEKFMFFELTGLQQLKINPDLEIMLFFDENLPSGINLVQDSFKLNCVPVINLFNKVTEPLPLQHKEYRYRLYPSREHYDCHEIVWIDKLFSVNKNGESHELQPYFCLNNGNGQDLGYRWLVQQEHSQRKRLAGSETWLSLFNVDLTQASPSGDVIYAEALCSNRSACELFPKSQQFSVIGSAPIDSVTLLTRPTRHRSSQLNKEHLWQMLSHLSLYYVSLTEEKLAKNLLSRLLGLYANKDNPASLRQIESIEKLETEDDVQVDLSAGWRGYYHGTKFTLTLIERNFDGSSSILFGGVLHQFLALFCHINSFVRLELKLGNRSIYQWLPMSGHRAVV